MKIIAYRFNAADILRQWWADSPIEAVREIAEEAGFDVDHEALEEWAAWERQVVG